MRKFSPISLIMMQSKLISKAKSYFSLIKEPAQPQNQHQNSQNLDPLICRIDAKCQSARALTLSLPHGQVNTPIYMPVGTKGAIKGITQIQMQKLNCSILLANTYHLATSLGTKYIDQVGGLHRFAGWNRNILTDSGGYQMVSFGKLIEVEEQGVHFDSPYGEERIFLRPEDSIKAQNEIGADIIMAFDDVIKTTIEGDRVLQSVKRTSRWFGRCWDSHSKREAQNLFPIIQGTTNPNDREVSLRQLMQFQAKGFAIGGLSGGQNKQDFYSTVKQCCDALPVDRPRYLMGVGYPIDLVLCAALGVDMFDCVFATRTARFGTAFTSFGQINLKGMRHANEFQPIESGCSCQTCSNFSRAYLCFIRKEDNFSHLISIHNVHFLLEMMRKLRTSIILGTLRQFLDEFIHNLYRKEGVIPYWVQSALKIAQISIQLKLSIKNEENRPNSTT